MAFHSFAFSGADRSEDLSAYFVAKLGVNQAGCGLTRPRLQAKMHHLQPPDSIRADRDVSALSIPPYRTVTHPVVE